MGGRGASMGFMWWSFKVVGCSCGNITHRSFNRGFGSFGFLGRFWRDRGLRVSVFLESAFSGLLWGFLALGMF